MANQNNLSRRAAMRQQQQLEEKQKRTNRIIGILAGIVAVAIVAIIAIVAIPPLLRGNTEVAEEQLTPPNATAEYGIKLNGAEPTEGTPHVIVYGDFRCPACKSNTEAYGGPLQQLADNGDITVEYRTTYFLDDNSMSDASARAAMAAAAADEVGHYKAYYDVLYANQGNFTETQLREDFPELAGIEGDDLTRFKDLYRTRAFRDFATAANQVFFDNQVNSTPTYVVNDQRLLFGDQVTQEIFIQPTAESLMAAIDAAYNGEDAPSHTPMP